MKKVIVMALVAIFAVSVVASCGTGAGSIKTEKDSLAYYAGANLANYIRSIDSTLNVDLVAAGLKDALARKDKAEPEAAYNFIREYMTMRLPLKNLEASKAFLEKVEKETAGIQKTESGLLYVIEQPGSDVKAVSDADQVRVIYHGTLPNGTVFDSSRERGDTAEFALNQVIKGWTEGMKLIGTGGKIKLWVPSALAYGEYGVGNGAIGPNQAIMFDVELIDVIPAPAVEEPAK